MLKEKMAFTYVIIISESGYLDHLLVGGTVPEAELDRCPWDVSVVSKFCVLPTVDVVIVTSYSGLSYLKDIEKLGKDRQSKGQSRNNCSDIVWVQFVYSISARQTFENFMDGHGFAATYYHFHNSHDAVDRSTG